MNARWIILTLAVCLGAATAMAQQDTGTADQPQPVEDAVAEAQPTEPQAGPKLPAQELTAQILYQVLLAEIAGSRGNIGLAVDAYRDLARTTRDPRVAQRAAQLAVFARRFDAALDAARLWAELDPESSQARQMVTTLLAASKRPEDLAEHLARQLAAEGPRLPAALLQLNRVLARMPDKRQVLRIIDQVTTPYLGVAEAHFARAVAALGAQDATRALGETERALALRPDWEQATLVRAQLLPRADAITVLRQFAESHKPSRDLRLMLARLYFGEKRYDEARREFRQLLAGAPDDADTLYAIGVLSFQLKDPAEAERHFRRLLELDYAEANSVRLYLGQIAEDDKRWSEALQRYAEIDSGEQYLAARLRQAGVLTQQGDLDAGLRHLKEARLGDGEGSKGDNPLKLLLGEAQLLREAGRNADALALLDAELAAQPDQPDLLYESALLAERLGRNDVVESRLRRVLQLKPDHAHAYNALGYSLAERNERLGEAQELIDKALALAPDDPFILDSKGWVLFRRGDSPGALDALQRAFAIRTDPEIAAHLGEVLWALARRDEAARVWNEAAKAHPANDLLKATIKRFKP